MAKVIVVDDDYSTTSLVKMLLEMEGYTVSTFIDPVTALEDAETGVGAFIIDCYLGKAASGVDLLRAIREHKDEHLSAAPVIMVSGDQRLSREVLKEGADKFLLKPYSPNDLMAELKDLIAARA